MGIVISIHYHNVFTNPSGLIVNKKIRKFAENTQTDKQTDRQTDRETDRQTDKQRTNKQTDVSKTESTLILSGSSPDTRGSWPIISHQKCRHPIPSPPSPSTVRSRDHTVLYCTIVLYSTKKE